MFFAYLLFGCEPTTQKEEVAKKEEPTPKPITPKIIPKGDTILLALNQANSDFFANSDKKIEFSKAWLEKALVYKGDTLPDSLVTYLRPIFPNYYSYPHLQYHYFDWNLDEDVENEKVLFLFNPHWIDHYTATIILENERGKWYVKAIMYGQSSYSLQDMMPQIKEDSKILTLKKGGRGTGQSVLEHYFYKKIDGQYREIGKIKKYRYFLVALGGKFSSLTNHDSVSYHFINSEQIQINRYFSLFLDDKNYIIKHRLKVENMKWDRQQEKFIELETEQEDTVFYDNVEKEVLHMAYHGTPEQQKHLDYYLISRGLKR